MKFFEREKYQLTMTSKDLVREIETLRKQCKKYEKMLSLQAPPKPKKGVIYKVVKGDKFLKIEGETTWSPCCSVVACWRIVEKDSTCPFHNQKQNKVVYYIPPEKRRPLKPTCEYICQNKSSIHQQGDICGRDAQYCKEDGKFVCTNHVNVLKSNGAAVFRKRDKKDIPASVWELCANR